MLHAEPTTISLAFPTRKQYAIPSYQRNYVWTRDGQWEPLWDDLIALAERFLADGQNAKPHFLGTIITKDIGTRGFINRWWVVDGQQRLTTLQILIAAVRSVLERHGLEQCAAILEDALINPPNARHNNEDKYKIQHKSSDYEGFSRIIDASLDDAVPEVEEPRLGSCYDYFTETVSAWLADVHEDQRERHAEALTHSILEKLQVVDIRLDGQENGHAIFEALNARGEPLTEWEKTKNYLLSIAVRDDDPDGDRTYKNHLEQYDSDPYWNQTIKSTGFRGKRIDLFLFFFAQIELPGRRQKLSGDASPRTLSRNRLYREFRYVGEHFYRRSTENLRGLLQRLNRHAEIYRQLDLSDGDSFSDYARLVMHRRERLNLASLMPIFMILVDKLGYGEDLEQALRIIDSYLMRRVAVKANYSNFDDVAFGHVQAVRDAPADEVCSVLMKQFEQSSWANRWPSDDEILLHLREADMYHRVPSTKKQLLLGGIAQRMHEERQSALTMPFGTKETLTVEHVAPQRWERHWKEDLGFGDSDEDERRLNGLVNRIGNLTLVTQTLNSRIGNGPWSSKAELLKEDNLEMNRRLLADMEGETWNEQEIDQRSRTIAKYVTEIWPHAAALRRELGIAAPEAKTDDLVSGISALTAERLVEGVTETGVEEGWADTQGLNRWRRGQRYGRWLRLGGGDSEHRAWFGVSAEDRRLVLDFDWPEDAPNRSIEIPDADIDEILEFVTTKVRDVADSIASTENKA